MLLLELLAEQVPDSLQGQYFLVLAISLEQDMEHFTEHF